VKYQKIVLDNNDIFAIDCGAAGGMPTHWNVLEDVGRFLLFEPDYRSYVKLKDNLDAQKNSENFRVFNCGISNIGGVQKLYRFNMGTGSSLLPPDLSSYTLYRPDNSYVFPIHEVEVETLTLNEAMSTANISYADLMKVDVQGVELDVVKSLGLEKISKLLALEIEVTLIPTYIGQTQLSDLYGYMHENGFELFDVCRWPALWSNRLVDVGYVAEYLGLSKLSKSVLHQAHDLDLLFFRKPDELLKQGDTIGIRKLVACYCTYGFYVSGIGLVDKASELNLFTKEESFLLREAIKTWHNKNHRLPGDSNTIFARIARRVFKRLSLLLGVRRHWTPQ
jgi:FkbM family methyltransferase